MRTSSPSGKTQRLFLRTFSSRKALSLPIWPGRALISLQLTSCKNNKKEHRLKKDRKEWRKKENQYLPRTMKSKLAVMLCTLKIMWTTMTPYFDVIEESFLLIQLSFKKFKRTEPDIIIWGLGHWIKLHTSSIRLCSCPMVSGRLSSLLLLALRTLRGKLHRQGGREQIWFRLQQKRIFGIMSQLWCSCCELQIVHEPLSI